MATKPGLQNVWSPPPQWRGALRRCLIPAAFSFAALTLSPVAVADATASLHRFLDNTTSFEATFALSLWSESRRQTTHSSGKLAVQKPGRFRWEVDRPYPQLIVGNGEKVWLYDPDLEQVSIRKSGAALGATPAALLTGSKAALAHFTLKEIGQEDGLDWIEAEPKTPESGIARMRLGFTREGELHTLRLFDNFGQITTIRLQSPKRNIKLPAATFEFTPPPGVEVLEE